MKRIPADVEKLMWSVAESNDTRAIDEFEQRFPDYKYELAKRVLMVRQLRSAKRAGEEDKAMPAFSPRERVPASRLGLPQVGIGVVALLLLATISYTLTRSVLRNDSTAQTSPPAGPSVLAGREDTFARQPEPTHETSTAKPNAADQVSPEKLAKVTIKIDGAPLDQVLAMVASEAKLELQMAPGMPNPKIAMAYYDVDALTVLEDMGKELGFTPFYQGGGKVLIVPAIDPQRAAENNPPAGAVHALEEEEEAGE